MNNKQTLTDAHKAWIRKTVHNGDDLIRDLERDAQAGQDIEKRMATLYKIFGMSAPMPSEPPTDETGKD